jgi:hypothetical protein
MKTKGVLTIAKRHMHSLVGRSFDVLELSKPVSPEAAVNLAKIISKLSPMVGNLIEFNVCEYLNDQKEFAKLGRWQRQDPGFPDTIFVGKVSPTPGFEVKAWFPLATEITARFKDSQNNFMDDRTHVAIIAWLPAFLIFGKPTVLDIVIVSGQSVAKARDNHYHNPPDYLVLEPGDTTTRTSNLQQTNTNGYKFQGTPDEFKKAQSIVKKWGKLEYSPTPEYQAKLRTLISKFPYRLDTNFAKVDRIVHAEIEAFKNRVYERDFQGRSIGSWNRLLSKGNGDEIRHELEVHLSITDSNQPVIE